MEAISADKNKGPKRVLIVGAGCFGLSTAYHLLKDNARGPGSEATPKYSVTVIDATPEIPATDAASSDLNKVVRSSYGDSYYTELAKDAIDLWKQGEACGQNYHECGVMVLGLKKERETANGSVYAETGLHNDLKSGARVQVLPTLASIKTVLPEDVKPGPCFDRAGAYLNKDGGWAAASKAMTALLSRVIACGGTVKAACKMASLSLQQNKVTGIILEDGTLVNADLVILATGAWSTSLTGLPASLRSTLQSSLTACGQVVATIRLDPVMAERYRQTPVILDFSSGYYMFPPNEDNIVKLAIHNNGHTFTPMANSDETQAVPSDARLFHTVPAPRTSRSHGPAGTRVPSATLIELHSRLCETYPELGALPLDTTRLCWYLDTPDEDWIIDEVAEHPSLFVATGGSGHAFKFLPIIGRLVKERIEGTMDGETAARFSLSRRFVSHHASRLGGVQTLNEDSLWGADEFNEYRAEINGV